MTLVESARPPNPVSSKVAAAGLRLKASMAAAVVISKNVIGSLPLTASTSSSKSAS